MQSTAHGSQAPPAETLHTTTEHPFLTTDRGFVNAAQLMHGEHVIKLNGTIGIVDHVQVVPGQAVRYNLTVQDKHTFAVGQDQWVVHNCGVGSPDSNSQIPGQPNLFKGQRIDPAQASDYGYSITRNVPAAPGSQDITDYFGTKNVTKVMQTWSRADSDSVENHYWVNNDTGQTFHYHKPGELNIEPQKAAPEGDFLGIENWFMNLPEPKDS